MVQGLIMNIENIKTKSDFIRFISKLVSTDLSVYRNKDIDDAVLQDLAHDVVKMFDALESMAAHYLLKTIDGLESLTVEELEVKLKDSKISESIDKEISKFL